jgi:hypothetical protein
MELLVSGAVVFCLVQLPSVIGPTFERLGGTLAGDLRVLGGAAHSYVTMVLWVLIGTFVLHLVLRAYWIGLHGFSAGLCLSRLRLLPCAGWGSLP